MKKIGLVLLLAVVFFSCGSKKGIVTKKNKRTQKTERISTTSNTEPRETPIINESTNYSAVEIYVLKYNAIAMDEMSTSKIPASITLAQGILESGSGKGRLSVEANNHFGIKCHGWKGQKIYHDDDASQECFRKYTFASESFKDHSEFLTGRGRYAKLFKLKSDDYKGWAKGLRAAGYATDRKYPQKLINLIERYQLYKYDDMVLGNIERPKDLPEDYVSVSHRVTKGDTLYSISKKYNTTVAALKRLNGLKNNDLSLGQMLIIKTR